MYLVNTHGFKSNVPDGLIPECLERGFKFPVLKETCNPASKKVLIHRKAGGLGDLIFMLPAVEDFIRQNPLLQVTVMIPQEYHSIYGHLKADIVAENIKIDPESFLYIYDCLCPCAQHEYETGYRPVKNRIENFAELLGVEPRKPALHADKSLVAGLVESGELKPPFIGAIVRSARVQKDYPRKFWSHVYEGLADFGFNVLQIDTTPGLVPHKNARSVSRLSLGMLMSVLSHLELLITPATGSMVMAGALGIPFLALLGPTDNAMTLKFFRNYDFIQGTPVMLGEKPCHVPCYYSDKNGFGKPCRETQGQCMKSINSEAVLKKVESMLDGATKELAKQRCLCGSVARKTLGEKDGLEIYRCAECGLVRSQRIDESDYKRFYREEYAVAFQKSKGVQTFPERFQHDLEVAEKRFRKMETLI